MEDQKIFQISHITAVFGLGGMMLFAGKITVQEIKIKDLSRNMLEQEVSIEGVVVEIDKSSRSNTYFISLVDGTGRTNVVIFGSVVSDLEKESLIIQSLINRRIKITGTVTEYNGRMELILKDSKSIKIVA